MGYYKDQVIQNQDVATEIKLMTQTVNVDGIIIKRLVKGLVFGGILFITNKSVLQFFTALYLALGFFSAGVGFIPAGMCALVYFFRDKVRQTMTDAYFTATI